MLSRIKTMRGRVPLSKLVKRYRRGGLPYLPPELLILIFEQLRLIDPPKMAKKKTVQQAIKDGEDIDLTEHFSDLGWIKIIHVCGLWRMVALRYAELWTDIPNCRMPSGWIMLMLHWSRNAQVSIATDLSTYTLSSALRATTAIRQALPRTKQLTLDVHTASLFGTIKNAPVLESLTLTGEDSILLTSILGPKLPRALTSLTLRGCFMPLTHPRFRTLRHLEIATHVPASMMQNRKLHALCSADAMTRALAGMPNLRTLRLRNVFPTMSVFQDMNFQHLSPVRVPEGLERLELKGGTEFVQEFLAGLVVPRNTIVKVVLDSVIVRTVDYGKVFRRVCGAVRKPRVVALEYGQEEMAYSFAVRMWDGREGQCVSEPTEADMTVRLDAWARLDGRVLRALAEAPSEALRLDEVIEVRCGVDDGMSPDWFGREWEEYDWKPILRLARGVETIVVSGRKALEGVVKALKDRNSENRDGQDSDLPVTVICPALTKLVVRGVEWGVEGPKEKGQASFWLKRIVKECLEARKNAGFPVGELEIGPMLDGEVRWVEEVREIGVDVYVVVV